MYYCAVVAIEQKLNCIPLSVFEEALDRVEIEAYSTIVGALPLHQKILFYAILQNNKKVIPTNDIYIDYINNCQHYKYKPLTDRMVRNFLIYFKEMGLIYADVGWSKALKKKSKQITLTMPEEIKQNCKKRLLEALQ